MLALAPLLAANTPYEATWESLDRRPNPAWFTDAKFGVFIHWGVYSVPAWGPKDRYSEWYWHDLIQGDGRTREFHDAIYGEAVKYQDFAPQFKAELFDPAHWADVFERAGAKYVVLTSKHHEGFCLWPNPQSWNWNSVDIGPHRDLAGDLTAAVRETGLKMGFYYSFYEWFNPLYNSDVDRYVDEYMLPQLKDLVQRYKPDIIWPDGEWSHPSSTWRSTEFLAWLFNESDAPDDVVINDRWGKECRNVHGGFATPEYGHIPEGKLIQRGDFEECQGMGRSFGYNRNETADNYRSTAQLLHLLIGNVSRGGNLLLDIGPTADGRIPVVMEQRLLEMGEWLAVNGDAIYGTRKPDSAPELEHVQFTQKGDTLYAISLQWPGETLSFPLEKAISAVSLLGHGAPLEFTQADGNLTIAVPQLTIDQLPCLHAWAFKLE